MKKSLFTLGLSALASIGFAQCDPSQHNSGLSTHPDSLWIYPGNLDCIEQGVTYSDVLYIKFPEKYDASEQGLGMVTLTSIEVDDDALNASLPSGITAVANETDWTWDVAGGPIGCVTISGTTVASVGEYIPTLDITAVVGFIPIPESFTGDMKINVIAPGAPCVQEPISVEELDQSFVSKIYPQPASSMLNFEFDRKVNNAQFKLINVIGEVVLTKNILSSNQFSVDVEGLSQGTYFYVLDSKSLSQTGKIMIQ